MELGSKISVSFKVEQHYQCSDVNSIHNRTGLILRKLREARDRGNHDAIAISITACSGDHFQVRKITDAIDQLSKTNLMPVYTFVEDYALDAGFLLLMAGKEAYANPFSLVGDVGKSYKTYYIGRLLQKLGLSLKQYSSRKI